MDVLKCVKLSLGHGVGGCPKGNIFGHAGKLSTKHCLTTHVGTFRQPYFTGFNNLNSLRNIYFVESGKVIYLEGICLRKTSSVFRILIHPLSKSGCCALMITKPSKPSILRINGRRDGSRRPTIPSS